jgi:hypothetical protein
MLLKLVHYVELHISQIEKIIVIYCKITNYFIYKTLNFVALHEKLFIVFHGKQLDAHVGLYKRHQMGSRNKQ